MKPPSSADRPIALTQGDPAGVGLYASLLAWETLREAPEYTFYLRANTAHIDRVKAIFGLEQPVRVITSPDDAISLFSESLPVLPLDCPASVTPGKPDIASATGIISSIELCVDDVLNGAASAVVTNPIAKDLLYKAGFRHPGHTEFLAQLASDKLSLPPLLPVMMLIGGGLRVALATIHIPFTKVAEQLSEATICQISRIVSQSLKMDFGRPDARLGICGLNPHAGENGTIGKEEETIISPAIATLRSEGINAIGPRPGDAIFHEMLEGRYDAIIAMYHDQGLIPVKTLDLWGGVNATLGLPFVRTSPDHGTGYDAAAKGQVRAESLIAAIKQAKLMAKNREAYAL